MSDQDLLELAAKAAGLLDAVYQDGTGWMEVRHGFAVAIWSETLGEYWNPLVSNADALGLAVDLSIDVLHGNDEVAASINGSAYNLVPYEDDRYAATRRAIVLTAAHPGDAHA